jgi:hypothetical protein
MPNGAGDTSSLSPPAPNPESYTDNGDGTVTDGVTGLMWQKSSPAATYPWGGAATPGTAQNYCATLTLAGHNDWRLPSMIELVSIVDTTVPNPAINKTYFPNTFQSAHWSAAPYDGTTAVTVIFSFGQVGRDPMTTPRSVRCVR